MSEEFNLSLETFADSLRSKLPKMDEYVNNIITQFNDEAYADLIIELTERLDEVDKYVKAMKVPARQRDGAKFFLVKMWCDEAQIACHARSSVISQKTAQEYAEAFAKERKERNEMVTKYNKLVNETERIKLKPEINMDAVVGQLQISNGILSKTDVNLMSANGPKLMRKLAIGDKTRLSVKEVREVTGAELNGTTHVYAQKDGISTKNKLNIVGKSKK